MMARPRQEINHGTYGGAMTHRKRGEEVCVDCRAAEAAYMREWRKDPTNRLRDKESQRARSFALTDLARENPARYQVLYTDHLRKLRTQRGAV